MKSCGADILGRRDIHGFSSPAKITCLSELVIWVVLVGMPKLSDCPQFGNFSSLLIQPITKFYNVVKSQTFLLQV